MRITATSPPSTSQNTFHAPTSLPKAVGILAAADRTAAFRRMMQTFRESYTPSPASDPEARPQIVQALEDNLRLMQKPGMHGTPGVVWKDRDGKMRTKDGLPRLLELPTMTGLPEQKVEDHELAGFR
jgi:thiol:disulfide interchange protein DsbG